MNMVFKLYFDIVSYEKIKVKNEISVVIKMIEQPNS